jgi:hypothetical protein
VHHWGGQCNKNLGKSLGFFVRLWRLLRMLLLVI